MVNKKHYSTWAKKRMVDSHSAVEPVPQQEHSKNKQEQEMKQEKNGK